MSAKAKEKQRYGVQVVYFGGIDRDLEATLMAISGRRGLYAGHGAPHFKERLRRDLFWPCFDRSEAVELAARMCREITVDSDDAFQCTVKTEEQHWDEKIKAALGNGLVAP